MVRGADLARWTDLHSLRRDWRGSGYENVRQETPGWLLPVQCLSRAVHRHDWDRYGTESHRTAYLAQSDVSALSFEEGHEHAPAASHARRQPQIDVVPDDAYPRGDARAVLRQADGRSRPVGSG